MKQYHVRVTCIYDLIVDAEDADDAKDYAMDHYWEQNNGLADAIDGEVIAVWEM